MLFFSVHQNQKREMRQARQLLDPAANRRTAKSTWTKRLKDCMTVCGKPLRNRKAAEGRRRTAAKKLNNEKKNKMCRSSPAARANKNLTCRAQSHQSETAAFRAGVFRFA